MFKHILIPVDGTEFSTRAIEAGVRFAKSVGARITGFIAEPEFRKPTSREVINHAAPVSTEEHSQRTRSHAEAVLARIAECARAEAVQFDTDFVENNNTVDAITDAAKKHACDLIVMMSHGHRGLARLLHGNATAGVLTHTSIPVLVLH